MAGASIDFPLSRVKDASGALDPGWIRHLAHGLGLRAFIETGTYLGQSLENVCAAFERAVSIELSTELYEAALCRFANRPGVMLLQGDSAHRIVDACNLCEGLPTLYWLDAHWSAGNTAKGEQNTPILAELALVAARASVADVVLIDDMRQFITLPEGFARHDANNGYPTIDEVLEVLTQFPDGGFEAVLSGDVLVCMARCNMERLKVSPVMKAITALRTKPAMAAYERRLHEQQIAGARAAERDVILVLPEHYGQSLQYGLGGDFCYWRALVREAEWDYDGALADLDLARRCNVNVPPRPWEGASTAARLQRIAARIRRLVRGSEQRNRDGAPA